MKIGKRISLGLATTLLLGTTLLTVAGCDYTKSEKKIETRQEAGFERVNLRKEIANDLYELKLADHNTETTYSRKIDGYNITVSTEYSAFGTDLNLEISSETSKISILTDSIIYFIRDSSRFGKLDSIAMNGEPIINVSELDPAKVEPYELLMDQQLKCLKPYLKEEIRKLQEEKRKEEEKEKAKKEELLEKLKTKLPVITCE